MTSPTESTCPKCGAPLADDAPQGLCPKCVLAEAATLPEATNPPLGRTPPPAIEEVAPHFPDLEILELIGAGGMGAVYKVRQPKLDRMVALKILSHDLSADPAFEERFNREARVLARLNHPHIVTVFDFGTAGPFCFLLMEFVDGVNLRQAMHTGGFTPADSLALVQDISAALAFAHEEGILHRDIKPENVLIDSRGRVKIADFGIAKLVGEDDRGLVTLTMQGSVLGSPHYMAPEQIETPGDVDQRADIYSLGVVFYELLTGELPIGRFSPPSERSQLDPRIDEVVMRTLEKEREARYQSASEVETRVEAITRSGVVAPAATTSPAPSPTDEKSGTARFATASAIFTGISIVVGVPLLIVISWMFFFNLQEQPSSSQPGSGSPKGGITFLAMLIPIAGFLIWSVPAVLGLILGTIALGDIRRSGGRKSGLGRALFGTLTWPVILIVAVAGLIMPMLLAPDGGSGPAFSIPLLLGIGLVASGIAAVLLVSMVGRWAKNTPIRTATAWLTAVLIIALLLVPSLTPTLLLAAGSPTAISDGPSDRPGPKDRVATSSSSTGSGIDWSMSKPEIELDFVAPAGRLTLFALRKPWDPEHVAPTDWYVLASDNEDSKGRIRIGKLGMTTIDGEKHTRVAATLHDSKGRVKATHTLTVAGEHDVRLDPHYGLFNKENPSLSAEIKGMKNLKTSEPIDLTKPGVHFIAVAGPAGSKVDYSLQLLAWSVPRPGADAGSDQPSVPTEARIGAASPPDFIDNWVDYRFDWLRNETMDESILHEHVIVGDIKGELRARTGLMFDTRERRVGHTTPLLMSESLLLKKGSQATIYPTPENPIRLGPMSEDAMVAFPAPSMWFLMPYSGLKAKIEAVQPGDHLQVLTVFDATLEISEPSAFQLTSEGRLEVWHGSVKVVQNDGEKTTVVESGKQFQFPEPAMQQEWVAEPGPDGAAGVVEPADPSGPSGEPTSEAPAETDRAIEELVEPSERAPPLQNHGSETARPIERD